MLSFTQQIFSEHLTHARCAIIETEDLATKQTKSRDLPELTIYLDRNDQKQSEMFILVCKMVLDATGKNETSAEGKAGMVRTTGTCAEALSTLCVLQGPWHSSKLSSKIHSKIFLVKSPRATRFNIYPMQISVTLQGSKDQHSFSEYSVGIKASIQGLLGLTVQVNY